MGFDQKISPRPIGPGEGCCGAAAFFKRRVIVADVATDPVWSDEHRQLALENGIFAAWSQPILTKDGEVLGTFALYAKEPRTPTDAEVELIEGAGHIALIAIGRQRSQEALRKSEAELRRITDVIPQAINVLAPDGRTLYVNRVALEYTGLGLEDVSAADFRRRVFHPDDLERVAAERQLALSGEIPFELELRVRRHDGKYRWFLIRYNPFRDEQGRVQRLHELLVRERWSRAAGAGGPSPQDERIHLHVLDDLIPRATAPVPCRVLHLLADLLLGPAFPQHGQGCQSPGRYAWHEAISRVRRLMTRLALLRGWRIAGSHPRGTRGPAVCHSCFPSGSVNRMVEKTGELCASRARQSSASVSSRLAPSAIISSVRFSAQRSDSARFRSSMSVAVPYHSTTCRASSRRGSTRNRNQRQTPSARRSRA